jgi:hypothetical protein
MVDKFEEITMTVDDLADGRFGDPARAVNPKGSERQLCAYRGTFAEFHEAIEIAKNSEPVHYVAMGPVGGYSIFSMRELPWGDVECEDAVSWPLDEVIVFVPPQYDPEPGLEAAKAGKIAPRATRRKESD